MFEIFLQIINMSISASWIVLAVLLFRFLFKKAPKWISVLLWGIVAVRLICPFSIESKMSLIPSAEPISTDILIEPHEYNTGATIIENKNEIESGIEIAPETGTGIETDPIINEPTATPTSTKADTTKTLFSILSKVWIFGALLLLAYTVFSYLRVKRKVGTAVLLRNNIYQSENVTSPFVLGIIKPKIYIPFSVKEQDMEHIISHEQAHIKRKDHLWKPLGFLLLAIHWFNPLMWLSYVLLCRDIELACDEKVVKEWNNEQRSDYSQTLLSCSVNRRMIAACPLAFGAVGVKNRVKSVLNYKRPAFWIIAVAVTASVVLAVCFLTNPYSGKDINDRMKITIDMAIANQNHSEHYDGQFSTCAYDIFGVKKSFSETTVYTWVLYEEFKLENGSINIVSGSSGPVVLTVDTSNRGDSSTYFVKEYWTPRDGSYYSEDIKEKFPKKMWSKVFDFSKNVDSLEKKCLNSAQEYFEGITNTAPETLKDIEGFKLDSIATSTKSVLAAGLDTYYRIGRMKSDLLQELADLKISDSPVANDSNEERYAYHTLILQTEQDVRQTSYQALPGIYIHFGYEFSEVWISTIWNTSCIYSVGDPQAAELIYDRITNYVSEISEQSTSSKLIYDNIIYGNENGKIAVYSDEYRSARPEDFDLATEAIEFDESHAVVTDAKINAIKASYPMFFDLPTESGLVVYIYQMASNSYSCILVPGKPEDYNRWELCDTISVGIAEMRIIINCYLSSGVSKDDIVLCAMQNPLSSHCYNIDDAYCENLSKLFWSDFPPIEATNISSALESTSFHEAIDTASFDIDGDGKEEKCILYNAMNPDSLSFGRYTFIMSAYENGELKYFNVFNGRRLKLNFQQDKNGKTTLNGIDYNNEQFTIDIAVKNGNIALNNDDLNISYWGKQGFDSPFVSSKWVKNNN